MKPPELDLSTPPEFTVYLFHFYCQIKTSDPISYQEIKAFNELLGLYLDPAEVEAIKTLDNRYYKAQIA